MKLFKNLKNFKITHKGLYWGLIATFAILYLCVGFVSTLHSITFFGLANTLGLAVLLGLTYEVGQASVLFSILMSEKNKNKFLPWMLMFLLTALQVTANVYASFKFMANSGNNDWTYWQKSILIGVQAANPEMYQVIISWIAGALLPVVALGMTALVAQNMRFIAEEGEEEDKSKPPVDEGEKKVQEFLEHEFKTPTPEPPSREEQLEKFKDKVLSNVRPQTKLEEKPIIGEGGIEIIKPQFEVNLQDRRSIDSDGVQWEAKPADLIGNMMSKLPNFKFTPPAPEIVPEKLDEILENEVKRRVQEIQNKESDDRKGIEKANQYLQEAKDSLDEEVERLTPVLDLKVETKIVEPEVKQIPVDIVVEEGEPEVIIPKEVQKEAEVALRRELGEHIPITKTRGWHLKKTYVDSNGDVYHFGKFSPQEKGQPEESKKA